MPVCMCASTAPGNARRPLPSTTSVPRSGAIEADTSANFPSLIAISPTVTVLWLGRAMRRFLISTSNSVAMRATPKSQGTDKSTAGQASRTGASRRIECALRTAPGHGPHARSALVDASSLRPVARQLALQPRHHAAGIHDIQQLLRNSLAGEFAAEGMVDHDPLGRLHLDIVAATGLHLGTDQCR